MPKLRPHRLRSTTILVYVPSLLLILAVSWAVRQAFSVTVKSGQRVAESTEIIAYAQHLVAATAQAQSSMRGFVIAGDESFLSPYHQEIADIHREWADLLRRLQGRPEQIARAEAAHTLLTKWQRESAEPAIFARRQFSRGLDKGQEDQLPNPALFVSDGRGNETISELIRLMEGLIEHEDRTLAARQDESRIAAERGSQLALWGPLAALTFALLVSLGLALRTVRSIEEVSQAAMDLARGNLAQRVHGARYGELRDLANAFNRMAESLAQRTHENELLGELGELLQATLSESELHALFGRALDHVLPGTRGRLYLLNASRNEVELATSWKNQNTNDLSFDPNACWALRRGKTHVAHGTDPLRCEHPHDEDTSLSICLPLQAQGDTLGLIQLEQSEGTGGEHDLVRLGEILAERFGLTLANLKLRDRLRDQSIRDPLTGLFNRRYLEETFGRELERSRRFNNPLGVIMLDLDHFKRLNDTQGHEAGDAVLQSLGQLLSSSFRSSDITCRYGGEEFVIVLPEATLVDAMERAYLLGENIRRMSVTLNGRTTSSITASMGVSAFPEDGASAKDLIRAADLALYRAKATGRNRVVSARDLTEAEQTTAKS